VKVLRAYKTEFDLNNRQRTACAKHAGAARFAYNWGLARRKQAYEQTGETLNAIALHRELNALKKTDLGWMYEVSKCAPQEALRDLDRAYANFFRRAKGKKGGRVSGEVGFPHFKKKKRGQGSFRLTGTIRVFEKHIQLPRLGLLRLKEAGYMPASGAKVLSATVSQRADRWFVSLQCEVEIPDPQPSKKPVCGVDLGVSRLATVSDGAVIENPKALKRNLTQIKRLQRVVSRRKKGSANRKKAVSRLAKAHARVANIRNNALHQATSLLAKTKSAAVLENLNVSGMLKNHRLAQAIADVGMFEFRRQMAYKGAWYGCEVQVADRFYPSSKTCSHCSHKKLTLGLGERMYICEACGLEIDRDLNAAINLESLYLTTASSAGSNACGEDVRPAAVQATLAEAGTKQQAATRMFA
jgi:putative transposase